MTGRDETREAAPCRNGRRNDPTRADERDGTPSDDRPGPSLLLVIAGMLASGAGAALSSLGDGLTGLAVALSGGVVCAIGIVMLLRGKDRDG